MARLGEAAGALPETFAGLAGMGDLMVTCFHPQGRNRRAGALIAGGATVDEAKAETVDAVRPFTMTSPERVGAVVDAIRYVSAHGIDGAVAVMARHLVNGEAKGFWLGQQGRNVLEEDTRFRKIRDVADVFRKIHEGLSLVPREQSSPTRNQPPRQPCP